jgi:glycosyltransferase involved in cell wall biosynthesis
MIEPEVRIAADTPSPLPEGPSADPRAVTALITARNEEEDIEECLRCLRWVDRILVIDHGSEDRTAEVCARYTRWVISRPFTPGIHPEHDNFNFGFALIPSGWVVQVDADERVSRRLAALVRGIAQREGDLREGPSAYRIPFRTALFGRWVRHGYWGEGTSLIRLFRAGRVRYPGEAVHEAVQVDGTVGALDAPIYHYPYPTLSEFLTKTDRYTSRDVETVLRGSSDGISGEGRAAADPSAFSLLWAPLRLFLWSYLRRGGWRDGRTGVAASALLGAYGLLEVLKIWEGAARFPRRPPLPDEDAF